MRFWVRAEFVLCRSRAIAAASKQHERSNPCIAAARSRNWQRLVVWQRIPSMGGIPLWWGRIPPCGVAFPLVGSHSSS